MIDRSFYAYTSDALPDEEFQERFSRFQGHNSHVLVKYVGSDFIRDSLNEMETLESIFHREEQEKTSTESGFNTVVDLCGVFKRVSSEEEASCCGLLIFHFYYLFLLFIMPPISIPDD